MTAVRLVEWGKAGNRSLLSDGRGRYIGLRSPLSCGFGVQSSFLLLVTVGLTGIGACGAILSEGCADLSGCFLTPIGL